MNYSLVAANPSVSARLSIEEKSGTSMKAFTSLDQTCGEKDVRRTLVTVDQRTMLSRRDRVLAVSGVRIVLPSEFLIELDV